MLPLRVLVAAACLTLAACASSSQGSDARTVTATEFGTVNFDLEPALTLERLSDLLIGQHARPPSRLEYFSGASEVTIVSLADFQQFCPQQVTPSHLFLVFINDELAGAIRRLPSMYRPPTSLSTFEATPDGRIRRVRPDATRRDRPLDLPLIGGVQGDIGDLRLQLEPMTGTHTLVCMSDPERAASNSGLSPLSPFAPMVVSQNNDRVAARRAGLALYAATRIGGTLDAVAYAQTNRSQIRAHPSADHNYYVVTIDLGGSPIPGAIMQARDVGYIGVRAGRVEWKAWEEANGGGIGKGLCLSAEFVPGEVRPGCTDTGFYFP